LRVARGIELRGSSMFRRLRRALAAGRERFGFRLVHFSAQRDHLQLLAEVQDRRALSRGMQGLSIRVAKALNRKLGRTGRVFTDRYHSRAIKTPREVRWALRYVLLNVRKHSRGDASVLPPGFADGCCSARWFDGWSRPRELVFIAGEHSTIDEPPVVSPKTWLLRVGWRRAGEIDGDDAPKAR
jgi:putative transposase